MFRYSSRSFARRRLIAALAGSVSSVVVGLGATPAFAQDGASAPKPAPTDTTASEATDDIIVTAQKRAQSANRVGITLSAISGDAIAKSNMNDITKLTEKVPGLVIAEQAGVGSPPILFLRGVGLNDFNTNNSSPVAIYADEVYKGSAGGTSFAPYDLDRIEVLKGPQGTLFGVNSTGGAVRLISRKPGRTFEFDGSASYGSYDAKRFEAAVNLPLSEDVRLRIAGLYADDDGYMFNLLTKRHLGGNTVKSVRVQLAADPTPSLSVLLSGQYDGGERDANPQKLKGTKTATGGDCGEAAIIANSCFNVLGYRYPDGKYDVATDGFADGTPVGTERDAYTFSGVINWNLSDVTVTSVSSAEIVKFGRNDDADGSPLPLLNVIFGQKSHTYTQELRAYYANDRFNVTVGGYYLNSLITQHQDAMFFPTLPIAFSGVFDNRQKTDSYSLFGQAEVKAVETVSLTVGARYGIEKRRFVTDFVASAGGPFTSYNVPLSQLTRKLTFKVGVDWKPDDYKLFYATISSGNKSAGFNGGFVFDRDAALPYGPENLIAYEVGAKLRFPSARLQWNSAAFYYDYQDIQVSSLVSKNNSPLSVLTSNASARIFGAETELTWRPVTGLTLSGSASYTNSKFTRFPADLALGLGNFTGNRTAQTPRLTLVGSLGYEQDVSYAIKVGGEVNANYRTKVFFDPSNLDSQSQGAYALVNASIFVGSSKDRWRVDVYVNNLTNQYYFNYGLDLSSLGFKQFWPGAPRTVGGRLSLKL